MPIEGADLENGLPRQSTFFEQSVERMHVTCIRLAQYGSPWLSESFALVLSSAA